MLDPASLTSLPAILQALRSDEKIDPQAVRDLLGDLGPEALPGILEAALDPAYEAHLGALLDALGDADYPQSLPHMVRWLDHPDRYIRHAAAEVLDRFAGHRFRVRDMVVRGWVQHALVDEAIAHLEAWWTAEGERRVPSLAAWRAEQARKPPRPTARERRFDVVASTGWAVLASGDVMPMPARLPEGDGVHLLPATVRLPTVAQAIPAVIERDARTGAERAWVRTDRGWSDATAQAEIRLSEPRPDGATEAPICYVLGPTGRLALAPSAPAPVPPEEEQHPGFQPLLDAAPSKPQLAKLARLAAELPDGALARAIEATIATWSTGDQQAFSALRARFQRAVRWLQAQHHARLDIARALADAAQAHPRDASWLAKALTVALAPMNAAAAAEGDERQVEVKGFPTGAVCLEEYLDRSAVWLEWQDGAWAISSVSIASYDDEPHAGEPWMRSARGFELARLLIDLWPCFDVKANGLPDLHNMGNQE